MSSNVSHGRGGAANIRPDDTVYADGEIVREGHVGDQGDGMYSSGRGGTGNIGGEGAPSSKVPHDDEVVPDLATRLMKEESHHVGRGGAGNERHVHKEKGTEKAVHSNFEDEAHKEGLLEKAKHLFHSKKDGA